VAEGHDVAGPPVQDWDTISLGCSGAVVRRSPDGRHHAKTASGRDAIADLQQERARQVWLAGVGFPAPVVVDWVEGSGSATMVSTTVPGIPASSVGAADAERAVAGIARLLADLHTIVDECPFDRSLATTLPLARRAVAEGHVDVDDLDDVRAGRTARSLLDELERRAAGRVEELRVCHGDASLPNLLLDPTTFRPTGVVDVGRLGVADRALDLALVARSMVDDRNSGYTAQQRDQLWSSYGIDALDDDTLDFYQLLDEFF
jgi:aminoglycoside phosphotransferase